MGSVSTQPPAASRLGTQATGRPDKVARAQKVTPWRVIEIEGPAVDAAGPPLVHGLTRNMARECLARARLAACDGAAILAK